MTYVPAQRDVIMVNRLRNEFRRELIDDMLDKIKQMRADTDVCETTYILDELFEDTVEPLDVFVKFLKSYRPAC